MKHDTQVGLIKCRYRAHRDARRIGTVHARNRDRFFARFTVIECDDPAPDHTERHFVFIFANRRTGVAFDTSVRIDKEFQSSHVNLPKLVPNDRVSLWSLAFV